ncbi:uncharacterized protein PHALS_12350 [Plasmopara halstedii]|uniref:Uncharacterized protein n=1 Tax=Plasmopara halstedii TaxID=4781 RepID=A0A0P1ALL9_PLAHL|nr:uncharacterized protein PHALS_12350 [Plasmopara halstedii]CEG42044.1 hypothetical protein PHALS_12350 [Plasmopara halstedii]|eukprot:XP_024578413.1 hypothetical protein PHALS_12350 [Plasmopara halstedii]
MSNVPDFGINESYEDKAVNNSVDKRSEDSIHFEKDDVDLKIGMQTTGKTPRLQLFRNFPVLEANRIPNATTVNINIFSRCKERLGGGTNKSYIRSIIGIDLEVLAQVAASELVFSLATQCTSAPFFRRMYFEVARMQGRLSLGSGISAVLVA